MNKEHSAAAPHLAQIGNTRHVVLVIFGGVQSLDLTGPLEVFAGADQVVRGRPAPSSGLGPAGGGYRITVVGPTADPLRTSSGLQIVPDRGIAEVTEPVDTLMVAGGDGVYATLADETFVGHIAELAGRSRRVASVCSGAFLLAQAGLLDGRRATTHWSRGEQLAARFPAVRVDTDPIHLRDGNVFTSAGVTAGMDLALALVEDDLGRDVALTIARWLVLFLRRPGGQSQFSAQLTAQLADRDELRELQHWIADHPDADCSVDALARRAGMSPRHLARQFAEQTGSTPARFVELTRLEAARRRLEESDDAIEQVASACGFGTTETMRRSFLRSVAVPPAEYRRRFRSGAA